jgi:uncharacterized protein with HEPN domain
MTETRLTDYLAHIEQAAAKACSYVQQLSKQDFIADERTQQAIILNLIIIGEAATKLLQGFSDFLDKHPEVPWRSMKGMRNRVAHGYFDINLDLVWDTVQVALPELLEQLRSIRRDAQESENKSRGAAP